MYSETIKTQSEPNCTCNHPYCQANHGQYAEEKEQMPSETSQSGLKVKPTFKSLLSQDTFDFGNSAQPNTNELADQFKAIVKLNSDQIESLKKEVSQLKIQNDSLQSSPKPMKNGEEKENIQANVVQYPEILFQKVKVQVKDEEELGNQSQDIIDKVGKELMELAKEARLNAYCPYSKYHVGSTILTKKGNYYSGCNVENASYGLTSCAERNAIFKAITEEGPDMKIKAISCYTDTEDGSPCGACRQVISEFSADDALIYFRGKADKFIHIKMTELLPLRFKLDH